MSVQHANNTISTYEVGWRIFEQWCQRAFTSALPASPRTVHDFVLWLISEGSKINTIRTRLNAIKHRHARAGYELRWSERVDCADSECPTSVCDLLRWARRDRKEKPRKRAPLTLEQLRAILKKHSSLDPIDIRDTAILLVGFASGWRRSELCQLDLADVQFVEKGMTLWQPFSKTDQLGEGRLVGIDFGKRLCPVLALKRWIEVRGKWHGPLFTRFDTSGVLTKHRLSKEAVYRLVKNSVTRIKVDPSEYGAHSLRAGFVTCAAAHGATDISIRMRTGWKTSKMIDEYTRPLKIFASNPLAKAL